MSLKLKIGGRELPKRSMSFKAPGELYLNINRFREYIAEKTGNSISNAELCVEIISQHLKSEADFWKRRESFPGKEPGRGSDDDSPAAPEAVPAAAPASVQDFTS